MINNTEILHKLHELAKKESDNAIFLRATLKLLQQSRSYFNWIGIYLLRNDTLELGPYLGKPTVHTHIPLNKGICGAAATQAKTVIVDDVTTDDRYLACSTATRSEIVVPILGAKQVIGEIDVDSDTPSAFTNIDQLLLEAAARLIAKRLKSHVDFQ